MKKFALLLAFGLVTLSPLVVDAAPAEQDCRSHTSIYDPGKTAEGFEATAKIGCHTYHWTSNTADTTGSGTVTFNSTSKVDPWEGGLPQSTGCAGHAAHQANLMAMYGVLRVPEGTPITVSYRCW